MFTQRKSGNEKKGKVSRKMNKLYRNIKKQKQYERREVKGIIRKEKRDKERFLRKNPAVLKPPTESRRYKVQKSLGELSKVKRPEHRISKTRQNLTLYKNKRMGRDIESRDMFHQQKKKYDAMTTLAETNWLNETTAPGFVELDDTDLVNEVSDLTQEDLLKELDLQSQKNVFDIELLGQSGYYASYSQSGKQLLLGGLRGHLASFVWRKFSPIFESNNIGHRIGGVQWMMDDTLVAVCGKQWESRVYDCDGALLHCVHDFLNVQHLEYLPYHLLLVGGIPEASKTN